MDTKKRKEEIQTKFNQVVAEIERLIPLREQLKGQFSLLDEIEKEENKDNKKDEPKVDTTTK